MKKLIAIILSVLMLVCVCSGCGSSTESASPGAGSASSSAGNVSSDSGGDAVNVEKKVVVGVGSDPETLTPYSSLYGDRYAMLCMIYQPLVCLVGNEPVNVLISGYDQVDAHTYNLQLFDNIYDTDGNHFTASDVVFCYEKAIETGNFSKLGSIESVKALDDYTVEFKFTDALVFGQTEVIFSIVFMVTQKAYEASPDQMATTPVGTTGYVLDKYVEGSSLTFTKAESGYWQTAKEGEAGYVAMYDANKLDTVEYHFISEPSQIAIALETGNIDIAGRISAMDMDLFAEGGPSHDGFTTYDITGLFYSITPNCADEEELSNINMRKAIMYAFDAQSIVDGTFDGQGVASKAMNTPNRLDYDPKYDSADYFDYNMDLAMEYLQKYYDETGKSASDVTITILVVNDSYLEKMAEIMQTYILKLGINCEISSLDSVTRKTIRNSREGWDLAIAGTTCYDLYVADMWDMQFNAAKSATGSAGGWVFDDHLQELLIAATSPATHSIETVNAFQDYMNEQCYAIGLCIGEYHLACANWVTDLKTGVYNEISPLSCTYDWSAK